ncbi:MAG: sulfotransferase [Pseudomonadota bacterium]
MSDLIHTVNMMRNVSRTEMSSLVKRVVVILGSPRSGSSLLKSILAAHPAIASLDGEIEPFLALTRNGFGYNSDSDAIGVLANKNDLADNIFDDLTVPTAEFPPLAQLKKRWEKRVLLQFPNLFSEKAGHMRLLQSLDEAMEEVSACRIREESQLQACILSKVFRNEPWRMHYYDGKPASGASRCFDESLKIEEPPFVVPRHYRRQFSEHDAEHKTLLFKTPPDAYRIGMYEQLFPNADIRYLHLTRGYAQTVNGLMDGWLSPVGFFSHDLRRVGLHLDIRGYSDFVKFGRSWWKFDLPPNWREFVSASLDDVCLNQWLSTHRAILASGVHALRISFEDFLLDPMTATGKLTQYLGLPEMKLPPSLPVMMATEAPGLRRWKKREGQLLAMGKRKEVGAMMEMLGYEMNPETWL